MAMIADNNNTDDTDTVEKPEPVKRFERRKNVTVDYWIVTDSRDYRVCYRDEIGEHRVVVSGGDS